MKAIPVTTGKDFKDFYGITSEIYKDNDCYRSTEHDILRLLIEGPSAFHKHASVEAFIIQDGERPVGRFALIHDRKLPDYIQVSFFEALPHLSDLPGMIVENARRKYPDCKRIVFGLNGHLNYGAGILLNAFENAPVFGLPYNPDYYQDYFREFTKRTMVSYRFPTEPFFEYHEKMGDKPDFKGITVRKMNKKRLRHETEIYTYLNNACFSGHPYWADRNAEEDFELFHPFRFLIKEENLLFAEKDGEPVGFFLWYPDFNELVKGDHQLGLRHVLRYHVANPITTFRFTEIAVMPGLKYSHAVQAMILHAVPYIKKQAYTIGEGGFIFEENQNSMMMTRRFLTRAMGTNIEPHRRYAVFESAL
ncbi:MAG: hypothetical protein ABFS38_08830 [Bacteroidota bacterium]